MEVVKEENKETKAMEEVVKEEYIEIPIEMHLKKSLEGSLALKKLRMLNIANVHGRAIESRFIEFVLRNAPFLEKIKITLESTIDIQEIYSFEEELYSIPHASPMVRISIW